MDVRERKLTELLAPAVAAQGVRLVEMTAGASRRGTVVRMTKRSAPTRELGRSRTPHGEV